jgi:hypothetical protein
VFSGTSFQLKVNTSTSVLDYNITTTDGWTMTADAGLSIQSASTSSTNVNLVNSTSGAHSFQFFATGSANNPGKFGVYDITQDASWLTIDGTANGTFQVARDAVFGWSSDPSGFAGADTGLARNAAGVIEVNNGTKGTLAALYAASFKIGASLDVGLARNAANVLEVNTGTAGTFAQLLASSVLAGGAGGFGYATGKSVGGTVTQGTSRTTGVTLNKLSGAITLFTGAPTVNTWVSFTVTNSQVAATDVVEVSVKSGTNTYIAHVTAVAAGSFRISFTSVSGTSSDAPVINFAVIKATAN